MLLEYDEAVDAAYLTLSDARWGVAGGRRRRDVSGR